MSEIAIGDKVTWSRKPLHSSLKPKVWTGKVRELREYDGWHYAIVETDPDGRLTMPGISYLTKLATQEPSLAPALSYDREDACAMPKGATE